MKWKLLELTLPGAWGDKKTAVGKGEKGEWLDVAGGDQWCPEARARWPIIYISLLEINPDFRRRRGQQYAEDRQTPPVIKVGSCWHGNGRNWRTIQGEWPRRIRLLRVYDAERERKEHPDRGLILTEVRTARGSSTQAGPVLPRTKGKTRERSTQNRSWFSLGWCGTRERGAPKKGPVLSRTTRERKGTQAGTGSLSDDAEHGREEHPRGAAVLSRTTRDAGKKRR